MSWLTLLLLFCTVSTASSAFHFFLFLRIIARIVFRCIVRSIARKPVFLLKKAGKAVGENVLLDLVLGGDKRFARDLSGLQLYAGITAGSFLKADPYLIYLSDTSSGLTFYKTDFDFKNVEQLSSIESLRNEVDNLFLDPEENLLYWGYKNSSMVGCWNITSKANEAYVEEFKKGKSAKTVGLGNGGTVYLYFPDSKELLIYIHESGNLVKTLNGLKEIDANMNCVDLDPRDLTQIFFDDCTGGSSFGRVLDINKDKIDESYIQKLPKCFDQWRITPDAELAYAVSGKEIYLSPEEGTPFEKYYQAEEDIVGFAAGNNAIFFTTKTSGKIFKVHASESEGEKLPTNHEEFKVEGSVKAMVLYDLANFRRSNP